MLSRVLLFAGCLVAAFQIKAADSAAEAARLFALRSALAQAPTAREADFRQLEAQLGADPIWPWVQLTRLRHQRAELSPARVDALLLQQAGRPVAAGVRRLALAEFAKRGDWPAFRRFDSGGLSQTDPELRCHALTARFARGSDTEVIEDALREWDRGDSLPAACDPVIAGLRRLGRVDSARVITRIEAAAARGNSGLMRVLAQPLTPELRSQIEAEASFIDAPSASALNWQPSTRTRDAVTAGLERLAKRDPEAAEALLDRVETPLALAPAARSRVRQAIALWSAASYLPDSAERFARVPAADFDERLLEWRVREALARRDRDAAMAALALMPAELRQRSRWRLVEARLQAAGGEHARARALLEAIADEASFHGFAAADLLDRDYPLCALNAPDDAAANAALDALPGLARAIDLFRLDRPGWAAQEWQAALADVALPLKALAVQRALQQGWYERASQALGSGDAMRYYAQRFPLPHRRVLRSETRRHGLDSSWVAGLIRSESSWMHAARSPADARGLMQLLPGTARDTARRLGRSFSSPASLNSADLNIELGTAYLRQMLDANAGRPALATAAYNAGPAAVARWLSARPHAAPLLDDPYLWLETVPFHETRDYVARVMAFSLIYDWVLKRPAPSLLSRMTGDLPQDRHTIERGFRCESSR